MTPEPDITINGQPLSEGQSMTLRVALNLFVHSLQTDGLGNADHGRNASGAFGGAVP